VGWVEAGRQVHVVCDLRRRERLSIGVHALLHRIDRGEGQARPRGGMESGRGRRGVAGQRRGGQGNERGHSEAVRGDRPLRSVAWIPGYILARLVAWAGMPDLLPLARSGDRVYRVRGPVRRSHVPTPTTWGVCPTVEYWANRLLPQCHRRGGPSRLAHSGADHGDPTPRPVPRYTSLNEQPGELPSPSPTQVYGRSVMIYQSPFPPITIPEVSLPHLLLLSAQGRE